jgi:hypoxanthine phosphoribosyltransferase
MPKSSASRTNAAAPDKRVHPDVERVLFTREQIASRVAQMATDITRRYAAIGVRELTIVGITNGAVVFVSDLLRGIGLHTRFDTVSVVSYYDATSPVAQPKILAAGKLSLKGRHVLVVDDILDTGNTLNLLCKTIAEQAPASIKSCVLLDKPSRRATPFTADYIGFEIPDVFVVGYGLDFAERYRNLPYVGLLKTAVQDTSSWDD